MIERSIVGTLCGVQPKDREIHGGNIVRSTAQRQRDPWLEHCVEYSSKTERSIVGTLCGVQLKDRESLRTATCLKVVIGVSKGLLLAKYLRSNTSSFGVI